MQMDTKSKSDHLSRKHKRVPKSPRAATSAHDTVPASHTARATTKLNRVGKKNKRKAADDHEGDSRRDFRGPKRSRVSPSSRLSQKRKLSQDGLQPLAAKKASTNSQARDIINKAPTERLNLYVFGSGESGELGLGTRNSTDVSRPRLNPNLLAASVGVVQVATGGMHCAALTYDNKILTWGVNDQGALGRDTAWEGGLVDIDDNKNDIDQAPQTSDNDTDLNPREAAPYPVDSSNFPEGTVFTQLAAGDSSTFALTNTGLVYGWGTFRVGSSCPNECKRTNSQ